MVGYSLHQRSITELLDASFFLMRDSFGAVCRYYVIPMAVAEILLAPLMRASDPMAESEWSALSWLIGPLAYVVVAAIAGFALTAWLASRISGVADDLGPGRRALARAVPIVATSILVGVLSLLGLMALVVPGIWCLLAFFVVVPVMAVDGVFFGSALRRSRSLMEGRMLAVLPVLGLCVLLEIGLAVLLVSWLGEDSVVVDLASALPATLIEAFLTVFALLLYLDARIRKESFDIEILAQRVTGREPDRPPATAGT